jgi:mevalonate kinase
MAVAASADPKVNWTSIDSRGRVWYQGVFSVDNNEINAHASDETSETLVRILRQARLLNVGFLDGSEGYTVTTTLNFPRSWGLGTSSTLINNIAQWANIDGFELLENSFGGSGYDIAAAQYDSPILYSKKANRPKITPVRLPWKFMDRLFFVHLNKKQNSKEGIALYRQLPGEKGPAISAVSALTLKITASEEMLDFITLMEQHESLISQLLGIPKIKDLLFQDYPGLVKSLGAWGGDFVLVTGKQEEMVYFSEKGYGTIIPFSEMLK